MIGTDGNLAFLNDWDLCKFKKDLGVSPEAARISVSVLGEQAPKLKQTNLGLGYMDLQVCDVSDLSSKAPRSLR